MLDEGRGGAKQQAVLAGDPVVVDHRADVAVGPAYRADALDQLIRQRLGHHLEGIGIYSACVQLRLQLVEEAVARPQQLAGAYRATAGAYRDALAVGHFQGRAVFEDARTMAHQCLRFAQQQVQGMHMATAHVQQGAAVGVAADDLAHFAATEKTDLVAGIDRLEGRLPFAQGLFLAAVEAM